ncbi:hypothetical protein CSIM01_00085 [Colletotrichum simmondsii]|uniref:Ubiquitin-like domain-containing protein n=1 Tax=Colletotrichum simmondsii TaxID=703756 RepID=A0A135SMC1_9PEZI|nr:hypothetical protein CSIM01_00085 [Colletotrichum simmondsii]
MSIGFTFGSLGDILQLCQIGIAASKALSDTSGSVSNYKDLRHDLDRFVQILQNVVATYQEREHPEQLSGINFLIQSVCRDCASDLKEALDYFQTKYGPSFSGQEHRLSPRTIGQKMGYAFKEKERLQKLREKLSWATHSLTLLLVTYNRNAVRVNNSTLERRYQEVLSKVRDISEDIERQNVRLSEQHASIEVLITTSATASDHLDSKATQDQKLVQQISNNTSSVQELSAVVETTMKLLVEKRENETSSRSYSGPNRASKSHLLFEDPFGSVIEIPIEWMFCWEHFKIAINNRFEYQLGHQKVLRGEYVLEDDISGQEVTSLPWAQVMRPGKKINMAMKFQKIEEESNIVAQDYFCPGCRTVMARRPDSNDNLMCRMWHGDEVVTSEERYFERTKAFIDL